MKGEFHEDFQSDHADQLDLRTQDFDWPGLYAAIGEGDEKLQAARTDLGEADYARLATALSELFHFVIGDPQTPRNCERKIGTRLIGLAWCLKPNFFEGSPALAEIARRLDRNKVVLSVHSADAHRKFGIKNRGQAHAGNFKPTLTEHHHEDQDDEHD